MYHESTTEKIRETAIRLFNEKGYSDTTMADISKVVGIKAPTIYFHYKSKKDLFYSILLYGQEKYRSWILEAVEANRNETEAIVQLKRMFRVPIEFYRSHRELYKFLFRIFIYPPESLRESVHIASDEWNSALLGELQRIFQEGRQKEVLRRIEPETLTASYFRYVRGYLLHVIMDDLLPEDEEIESAWILYYEGIRFQ